MIYVEKGYERSFSFLPLSREFKDKSKFDEFAYIIVLASDVRP